MAAAENPLLQTWDTPFGLPPFSRIAPEHYRPAFDQVLAAHRVAIEEIAADPAPADFANTIAALERSWNDLNRISAPFYLVTGADTNDTLEAIDLELSPVLARHHSEVFQHAGLFRRIDTLWTHRDALGLGDEEQRALERYHIAFVRAGAALAPAARARLTEINERLAFIGTTFGQNVLADEKAFVLVLDGEADLAGLPDFVRQAAQAEAAERGLTGKHAISLSRSSVEPFLQFSARRDLREKAWRAFAARGEANPTTDNKGLIAEMVQLRDERARLLGFASHAHYRLDDAMAKTPQAARGMLDAVWGPARARALRDRDALQAIIAAEGGNFALAPWDWRYYAEKLRQQRHALDEADVKPYLQLDQIIAAAFDTAHRLFGLDFKPLAGMPVYHPDVRVWEVTRNGKHVGLFVGDYFSRPSKHSGAWMTSLRDQERLSGETAPIIINVMNFAKAEPGTPSLLSFDDAHTLFHEFGHALHGLLSDVVYPVLSGTSVATDFVEFPSQLYEHWLEQPEVLGRFARHYKTGAPMPQDLLDRLLAAKNADSGFAAVEYVSSAIVDLDFHTRAPREAADATAFEKEALARISMPAEIVMRHRSPHFTHVFTGEGYASAYYSYMWSEMLDADGFAAFKETGDVFDPATARRLHDFVYSAGNKRDPAEAYRLFRGALPTVNAVLEKRGLADR
jgi:peptidyl-dipeptidase Dcp